MPEPRPDRIDRLIAAGTTAQKQQVGPFSYNPRPRQTSK